MLIKSETGARRGFHGGGFLRKDRFMTICSPEVINARRRIGALGGTAAKEEIDDTLTASQKAPEDQPV